MFNLKSSALSVWQKRVCVWGSTLLLASVPTTRGWASPCDLSDTILRDTLYGTAIGAGVGALYMVASSANSDRLAPGIATSALIGAGAGFILGMVDLSYSGCFSSDKGRYDSSEKGFHVKPLVALFNSDGQTWNASQIGSGLTLTYFLER